MTAAQAWPFLVARGRERGYSVLLAPDFLVADGDYGFLEEQAVPSHTEAVHVADGQSMHGHAVCLVWTERVVSAEDAGTAEAPRDTHSRPLRLVFGFLCVGTKVAEPAAADLGQARDAALSAYRSFLADEDAFTVAGSPAFPMRSTVTAAVAEGPPPQRRRVTVPAVLAGVVVAAVAVVAVLLAWPSAQRTPDPLPACGVTLTPVPKTAPTNCTTTPVPKKRGQ